MTDEIETGLSKFWENPSHPYLLEISMDIHINVYPKIMFGSPIIKMESKVK